MAEKQRFYRAISKPLRTGDQLHGRQAAFSFRADDKREATDHAKMCLRLEYRGGFVGLDSVHFLGTVEPEGMGQFILI